jgi:LmbE family N-acetylglucosaminyl deacetylase
MAGGATHLLGVFAHPDDEVFCGGGTFAKSSAAGWRISVVSATRGEAGQIRDGSIASRQTLPVSSGSPPSCAWSSRICGPTC